MVRSGAVQGTVVQQDPAWGKESRPPNLQASSKKRGAIDIDDGFGPAAKRQETRHEGGHGSPIVKPVEFRPANRAPPTEEDLELTRPVQKAKSDAEGDECVETEEDVEIGPALPQATMSKRVSELRGGATRRSSRSRHQGKVARRSEYGLRSGLRKEWSMG